MYFQFNVWYLYFEKILISLIKNNILYNGGLARTLTLFLNT